MKSPNILTNFQSFAEGLSDAVVITTTSLSSPGPKIVYVNPAFTRITKYKNEEVLGKSPRILQGPKSDRAVLTRLRQSLPEKHEFFDQIINYDKNGNEIKFDWYISALYDDHGQPSYWVAVQHDITNAIAVAGQSRLSALIVSQNHLTCSGLRNYLGKISNYVRVHETDNYARAREIALETGENELVVVDWDPPKLGSISELEALIQAALPAPTAVLSASPNIKDVRSAFGAGAKAYIPQFTEREPLIEIFKLLMAGGTYVPWFLTGLAMRPNASADDRQSAEPPLAKLTKRQQQIVQYLARGLSNEDIGKRLGLKLPTVKAHVSRLMKALGAKNRVQAAIMFQQQKKQDDD